ncbi:hypothetical protein [Pelagibacterium lentulum]|uniref:Uncharacterized protein n=1 Tax=Pelagibacterium lentulum TaxID=2029865 RepID=A0A916RQ59_9HYPH|nr:hypothetical protein [Pelagibacterium lentulum]GGA64955.1 hypothetical protein GCM10011499_39270 [Pelagibacterium lentulum]
MDYQQKQLVEQVAGVSIATADMTCRLILRLVNLNKLTASEAVMILGDEHGHLEDLAKRNRHVPGSALVYERIAQRVKQHMDQLQADTGASVEIVRSEPGQETH